MKKYQKFLVGGIAAAALAMPVALLTTMEAAASPVVISNTTSRNASDAGSHRATTTGTAPSAPGQRISAQARLYNGNTRLASSATATGTNTVTQTTIYRPATNPQSRGTAWISG